MVSHTFYSLLFCISLHYNGLTLKRKNMSSSRIRLLSRGPGHFIIHKPPGIPFHRTGSDAGVLETVREMQAAGELPPSERLFPVHRLDRVTSGILVFACGRAAANELGNAFRHNRIEKYYLALSDRRPHKKQGLVVGDMERGRRGQWILSRSTNNAARTRFWSQTVTGQRPGLRLYLVRPLTGKTHQIRVALKSVGAPILGDPQYSRFDLAREEDRTYLHAVAIRFRLGESHVQAIDLEPEGREFATDAFKSALLALAPEFCRGEFPSDSRSG